MRLLLLSLLLAIVCMATALAPAEAFNPFGAGTCNGGTPEAQNSAACQANTSDPIAGDNGILLRITNIIAYLGGAIA